MGEVKDEFDLLSATLRPSAAFEAEVLEVPTRPGRVAKDHLGELARDLASFASRLAGQPFDVGVSGIREPDTLLVHGPGLPAHGFKLVAYGEQILIGPASVLADKTLLPGYLAYLNRLGAEAQPARPSEAELLEVPASPATRPAPKKPAEGKPTGAAAFVLARIRMGKLLSAMEQIAKLKNVTSVKAVVGPYDLIARVSGSDQNEINRLILERFGKIDGVAETLTCNVIDLQSKQ